MSRPAAGAGEPARVLPAFKSSGAGRRLLVFLHEAPERFDAALGAFLAGL